MIKKIIKTVRGFSPVELVIMVGFGALAAAALIYLGTTPHYMASSQPINVNIKVDKTNATSSRQTSAKAESQGAVVSINDPILHHVLWVTLEDDGLVVAGLPLKPETYYEQGMLVPTILKGTQVVLPDTVPVLEEFEGLSNVAIYQSDNFPTLVWKDIPAYQNYKLYYLDSSGNLQYFPVPSLSPKKVVVEAFRTTLIMNYILLKMQYPQLPDDTAYKTALYYTLKALWDGDISIVSLDMATFGQPLFSLKNYLTAKGESSIKHAAALVKNTPNAIHGQGILDRVVNGVVTDEDYYFVLATIVGELEINPITGYLDFIDSAIKLIDIKMFPAH